ncbi:hypothetical protein L484_007618 [Morus notabilis]|uniref:Uncharacterized protein n=1 Tax=Morus notabilis TaxID=981085 RepID=W9RT07_9ROSA|nr:hypothetical protein L484_007618 [Morus notabilis]
MEHKGDSPTASHKPKQPPSSLCNISCCFGPKPPRHQLDYDAATASPVHVSKIGLLRCSSVWRKSRAHDHLPEIKDKCRGLISRIGRGHHNHRRRHSADFRYDALGYSQNFDEGDDECNGEEFPFRNFSSRLPPSPPEEDDDEEARYTASSTAKEIVSACS